MTHSLTRRGFLQAAAVGGAGLCLGPSGHAETAVRTQPNIVLIMADDLGFSDIGCYGGEIQTPNLDALAADGLRFPRFYNAARCCPTRASLLTGLYPHQAGMGRMVTHAGVSEKPKDLDRGPYQGYLADNTATIAEALRPAGYRCYLSGKWHVGEFRPYWPVDRGFDRYYGMVSGAMNYFGDLDRGKATKNKRIFAEDDRPITPPKEGFYTTDAFTDQAIAMLGSHPKDAPFFLYLAYNAPHWPLHAHPEDIARYRGRYRDGWAALRAQRYERMKEIGIIAPAWALSPPDPEAADWEALDDAKRDEMDLKMAVYAAQVDCMDRNIGRLVGQLKQMGCFENTLVLFLSDNGACHETGALGKNHRPDLTGPIGSIDSFHSYGRSWSNASNTPFRLHKHWAHEGGCASPLIAHWPEGIATRGALHGQVGHVIDLLPTFLDLAGTPHPSENAHGPVQPLPGISLAPCFNSSDTRERELYWEHFGNRAARIGDWKLVADGKNGPWELYNLAEDRTELKNRVKDLPDKAAALEKQWRAWARHVGAEGA